MGMRIRPILLVGCLTLFVLLLSLWQLERSALSDPRTPLSIGAAQQNVVADPTAASNGVAASASRASKFPTIAALSSSCTPAASSSASLVLHTDNAMLPSIAPGGGGCTGWGCHLTIGIFESGAPFYH